MTRCTAEERALSRASIYRLLALSFSYPTSDVRDAIAEALPVAAVAGGLLDAATAGGVERVRAAFESSQDGDLERSYQHVFTLTYNEDCPPYETAFSASHIFQQTSEQADIGGFYRAFGVDPQAERPDHLIVELEFTYLLALKEAHARGLGEPEHVRTCRDAQRLFLRQHLARWAPLIGQRVAVTADGSLYGAAARLLIAFVRYEERFLRLGAVERFRDEPVMIADDPGDMTCPMEDVTTAPQVTDLPLFESEEEERNVVTTVS